MPRGQPQVLLREPQAVTSQVEATKREVEALLRQPQVLTSQIEATKREPQVLFSSPHTVTSQVETLGRQSQPALFRHARRSFLRSLGWRFSWQTTT